MVAVPRRVDLFSNFRYTESESSSRVLVTYRFRCGSRDEN
jgi:hypothetical protein